MNRREFLASQGVLLAGSVIPVSNWAYAQNAQTTVKYLGWQGYDDAQAAKPLAADGILVDAQYITNSAEVVTKLRSGGLGTIDVVTPSIDAVQPVIRGQLVQPLDFGKMPSTERLFPQLHDLKWQKSDGQTFALPIVWSDLPMNYRVDLFGNDLPRKWADLGQEKYRGRLITLDDYNNLLVMARGMFDTSDFSKMTKAQVSEVASAWLPIKKNLLAISPSYGDIVDVLARGEAHATVLGWRFIEIQLKKKGLQAGSYVPEDGSYLWCDSYSIAKDAPNLDASYKFIDQMLSAEGNALVAATTGSGVVNQDSVAHLPDDQKTLYPYDKLEDFFSKNSFYTPPVLEAEGDMATLRDWTEAWERIKLS